MRERPILFTDSMVRAIQSGQKTATRRPMKTQPWDDTIPCPFGVVGDQLWVRECWSPDLEGCETAKETNPRTWLSTVYRADRDVEVEAQNGGNVVATADGFTHFRWRPSIHMKREDSRINLRITSVKASRLHPITDSEVNAEGFESLDDMRQVWDDIYSDRGFGWSVNPWVWAVEFEVV